MIHTMKNKYIVRSRISEAKFRSILLYFCMDIEAIKIAKICKVSQKTMDKIIKQKLWAYTFSEAARLDSIKFLKSKGYILTRG